MNLYKVEHSVKWSNVTMPPTVKHCPQMSLQCLSSCCHSTVVVQPSPSTSPSLWCCVKVWLRRRKRKNSQRNRSTT